MNDRGIFKNSLGKFKLKKKMKQECYGCKQVFPKESLTILNEEHPDILICPTCAFIVGLYIQSGIRTMFSQGSLALSQINSQFRKAALEFMEDPIAANLKYLKPLNDEITERTHIRIPDKKIRTFDQFPFIFLTPEEVKKHHAGNGKEFTLYGETLKIKRRVHYMMKMGSKMSEKYGQATGNYVCFMTEE